MTSVTAQWCEGSQGGYRKEIKCIWKKKDQKQIRTCRCLDVYVLKGSELLHPDLLFSFRGHTQACHNAISCPLRWLLRSTEI